MDAVQGRRRDGAARRRSRAFLVGLFVAAGIALGVAPPPALAAPETTIDSGPSGFTTDSTPTFTFSSPDPDATFECAVDSDTPGPCSGQNEHTTSTLPDGPHTFIVQARDTAGNAGPAATRSFNVDTQPPETTVESGPSGATNDQTPTFTFTSPGSPFATFECSVDSGGFGPCSGPGEHTTAALADGTHTFEVRATDVAGNVDQTPAVTTFTVDTVPPETTIDSGPASISNNPTPEFSFSSGDASATFTCRLDGQSIAPCFSPFTSPPLSNGAHTFEVLATDAAGNLDASPALLSFTIDTALPPSSSEPVPPDTGAAGSSATASAAPVRAATSFVLIAKRTIRVSRRRLASVTVNCAGSKNCAGVLALSTAGRVRVARASGSAELARKRKKAGRRRARRRVVKLGSTSFQIPARATSRVRVRLSRKKYRLVRRLGRVRVTVTVTDRDGAGRARIGTREIILRAR